MPYPSDINDFKHDLILGWTIKRGKNLSMENWCFICHVIFSHPFECSVVNLRGRLDARISDSNPGLILW